MENVRLLSSWLLHAQEMSEGLKGIDESIELQAAAGLP